MHNEPAEHAECSILDGVQIVTPTIPPMHQPPAVYQPWCPSPRAQRLERRRREGTLNQAHMSDSCNSPTLVNNRKHSTSSESTASASSLNAETATKLKEWLVDHQQSRYNSNVLSTIESLEGEHGEDNDVKQARAVRRAIQSLRTSNHHVTHELRTLLISLADRALEVEQANLRALRRVDNMFYSMNMKNKFEHLQTNLLIITLVLVCVALLQLVIAVQNARRYTPN